MNDGQRRLVLAVLPHLSNADRLIDALHRDGYLLEGSLLLGGNANVTSVRRALLSMPGETPLWHVADAPPGLAPPALDQTSILSSPLANARERIEWVARDLSTVWYELHEEHLVGDAVLGLLPVPGNHEREARFGQTVLDHAHGFFGLFELLNASSRH